MKKKEAIEFFWAHYRELSEEEKQKALRDLQERAFELIKEQLFGAIRMCDDLRGILPAKKFTEFHIRATLLRINVAAWKDEYLYPSGQGEEDEIPF